MTAPRPSAPSSLPGAAGRAHAPWRTRRARPGVLFVLTACLAVCLAAASPAPCAEAPAVTGVAIGQVGVFMSAPPQEATPKGSRYRLSREGPDVAAAPGVRFGVVFEVQGKPTGGPVVIEAGLVPPGDAAVAQRWFVPAVVGEQAQAVASFVYGWEAVPGPWRLTLSEDGRVLAEQTFHVGGGPRTSADHAAAPPSLSAPAQLQDHVQTPVRENPPPPAAPAQPQAPAQLPVQALPPAPAQALVTAREAPPMTSGSPAAAAPATPAVSEHPAEAGQAAVSGQAVVPASAGPPPTAPGAAPGGHAPPAAASPVTDSPPGAPGAPETAESAEPSHSPGKTPEMVPAPASDKGKKAVSPEQGLKAPEKAPAKETAKEKTRETANAPAKKETAKETGTLYLLQTGLFSVKGNAAAEAARYRAKGYPGCVLEEGAGSRRRYRVIVGRFPDQGRAMEARRSFVAREGMEAMVKEVPAVEVSRRLSCR